MHFEIGCKDRAKTEHFFGELFGWRIQDNGAAAGIDTGSPQGIPGHISSLGHEPHHYTIFYVEVENVQDCIDEAKALGGKMLVPPVNISGGTFAWIADPDGNTVGLWKPEPAAPTS